MTVGKSSVLLIVFWVCIFLSLKLGLEGGPTADNPIYATEVSWTVDLGSRVTSYPGLRRTGGFPGTQDFQCSLGKSQANEDNWVTLLGSGKKMNLSGHFDPHNSCRGKTASQQALLGG